MSVAAPSNEEREAEALRSAQRAHEPSMEEILASIRAIIADDRESPPPSKAGPQIVYSNDAPSRPSAPVEEEPQASATVVWARAAPPPSPQRADPEPSPPTVVWSRSAESVHALPADEAAPTLGVGAVSAPVANFAGDDEPLLSEEAGRAVSASFEALSESMAAHGLEIAEGVTRELLKPMIKSWLDENLPAMVERLVRAEIARVTRGAR